MVKIGSNRFFQKNETKKGHLSCLKLFLNFYLTLKRHFKVFLYKNKIAKEWIGRYIFTLRNRISGRISFYIISSNLQDIERSSLMKLIRVKIRS